MEYDEQLQEMAEKDPRVVLTGMQQREAVAELLSNTYAFVLPSDIEGMSISLLEAMSFGCCCLVSDIRENTEVVENRALTFRKGDVSDLREKLISFYCKIRRRCSATAMRRRISSAASITGMKWCGRH